MLGTSSSKPSPALDNHDTLPFPISDFLCRLVLTANQYTTVCSNSKPSLSLNPSFVVYTFYSSPFLLFLTSVLFFMGLRMQECCHLTELNPNTQNFHMSSNCGELVSTLTQSQVQGRCAKTSVLPLTTDLYAGCRDAGRKL